MLLNLILVLAICYLVQGILQYSIIKPYTIKDVKNLLNDNSVQVDHVLLSEQQETGICNCSQVLVPLTNMQDSTVIHTDIVLGYTRGTSQKCSNQLIFPVYRILLNQTSFNYGLCKNGHFSRDLQDVENVFPKLPDDPPSPIPVPKQPTPVPKVPLPTPKEPIPPKLPPKIPSDTCPVECVDLIRTIPQGPPGPTGPIGPRGPQGLPGPIKTPTENQGIAPPRKQTNVTRTFADVVKAFSKYTGCNIETHEGYLWNVNNERITDCKVVGENWKMLKDINSGNQIRTGYVILWYYYNNEASYLPAMAYRSIEDDMIPVLCGHDPSPVFLSRLQQRQEDIRCSYGKPQSFHEKYIYHILGVTSSTIVTAILVYWKRTRLYLIYQQILFICQFINNLLDNNQLLENQPDAQELEVDGNFENL